MTFYGRLRPDRRETGPSAAGHYHRRRQRRRARLAPGPTLAAVADPEHLLARYRRLEALGGHAPGPDGVSFADLGAAEAALVIREAGKAIRRGDYRPGPARRVAIPKASGGTRTLAVANLADRVVGAALADVLTPTFEATFRPGSFGFRPGRGTWDLLADLGATLAARPRLTTLAVDDVKRAFDHVPIAPLLEAFAEHVADPRLLDLIKTVLRGGDDRDRAVGIAQGCPLSPLALNVLLSKHHDVPLDGAVDHPPWWRYADNLAYLTPGVPEGDSILDRVRGLLAPLGLALKGADGPPVDLRTGEAQLLGFRVGIRGGRLRLRPGQHSLAKLTWAMEEAHLEPEPPRAARAVAWGWIAAMGPAFASERENARTATGIARVGATLGFRELGSPGDLARRCSAAYRRWVDHREAAIGQRGGDDLSE